MLPFRFGAREQAFLSWAGLRGAVPIVLATFALSAQVADSGTIFNTVFFVVLVSTLAQGLTLEPLARRLRLTTELRPYYSPPVEVGVVRDLGGEIVEFEVAGSDAVAGARVRDLALPRPSLVMLIVRGDTGIPPRGSTKVEPGDRLYVFARAGALRQVEADSRALARRASAGGGCYGRVRRWPGTSVGPARSFSCSIFQIPSRTSPA